MSGASLFFWRGVGVICVHSVAGGFIFYCQRIPPGNGLGPWKKTGGGGSYFVAVPVADPVAGRCEFSGGGSSFFLILTPFYLCIERGKNATQKSVFSPVFLFNYLILKLYPP